MKPAFLNRNDAEDRRPYTRSIGWLGTTALAMGGSNQSLFLIAALFAGQGSIPGQGSAAVPLLLVGLILSYAALPGWIELVLMSPNRVGGIAAACTEAFKRYGPILSTLTGMCYWWGWVPTCGLTAILSATAIHQWFLPGASITWLAIGIVVAFTFVNLCGIRWVTRLAVPVATCSATLAFLSMLVPIFHGSVLWGRAFEFRLTMPFPGWFGALTSAMAGLYLIGFAAPAFEAAACHAGETIDAEKNVPRAMKASAAMAAVYFVGLPIVWLGSVGSGVLGGDLGQVLSPTFAPVFGALAKSVAIWFMMFNMFHGTLQPLAGAARTLSQISSDGLAPRFLGWRSSQDVPVFATLLTAGFSIVFLLIGDPIWLVAAANFTYLIGIAAPSVAVWLLRRDEPDAHRPYRAPRYTVGLGLVAAIVWLISTILGFEQFGLPTVVFGLAMAYSGAAVYAWRKWEDRRKSGLSGIAPTLHVRLTGAMLLVLALDGAGYILAVSQLPQSRVALSTALEDIFVAVAILTITVGIVLPGVIAHSAQEVSKAARDLAVGTLKDFSNAMNALGRGDLDAAQAVLNIRPVHVRSRDELGEMAISFNALQREVAFAAHGLGDAREGLRSARARLTRANDELKDKVNEQRQLANELRAAKTTAELANSAKNQFMARMSHELRTPLNGVLGPADMLTEHVAAEGRPLVETIRTSANDLRTVIEQILDVAQIEERTLVLKSEVFVLGELVRNTLQRYREQAFNKGLACSLSFGVEIDTAIRSDPDRLAQILSNLVSNAIKFTRDGGVKIGVSLERFSNMDALVRFSIEDSGQGIPPDQQETIFVSFAQADESRTRLHDGAGVGLFLVRELVARLNGSLSVQSEWNVGSTFSVTLPVKLAGYGSTDDGTVIELLGEYDHIDSVLRDRNTDVLESSDQDNFSSVGGAKTSPQPEARRSRILLAEDNPTNQAVALAALRRFGVVVDVARDGLEAVRRCQAWRFDLVLMDCHMPRMDGIEATAMIRTHERERGLPAVPIVAVTADLTSANIVQCRSVGIDSVIAKPFSLRELSEVVTQFVPLAEKAMEIPSSHENSDHGSDDAAIDPECLDMLRELADETNPSLVVDVVSTYIENATSQIAEMRHAFAANAFDRISRIAHALKSASAYVGALAFSARLKELEQVAANGDSHGTALLITVIDSAFSEIAETLPRIATERGEPR